MYRIVFYCCTVLLLALETFVHSQPYELNHGYNNNNITNGNNHQIEHENQVIYSVGKEIEHHEIIEEEPEIFDISTQVAKFILYFIKKYCKNSEKITYLQNLLTTKGIGSIFKTNADGKLQPNYAYFENNGPPQNKIESTNPKLNVKIQQGHAINDNFATAPNHELQTPTITINPETKQKTFTHRIEVTTQNIHVSKQYRTPLKQQQQQQHEQNQPETEPKYFYIQNEEPLTTETIERPQSKPSVNNMFMNVPPASIYHQQQHQVIQPKVTYEYEHGKPQVFEPMYEYASHGDEYGITEDEYALPDYDYSIYTTGHAGTKWKPKPLEHINIEPKISAPLAPPAPPAVHAQFIPKLQKPVEITNYEVTTKHSTIINDWYKYKTPEYKNEQPHLQPHLQPQENTYEFKMPQHTQPQLTKEKPLALDDWYKYNQATNQPNEHNYEYTMPQHKVTVEKETPGILDGILKYLSDNQKPEIHEHTTIHTVPQPQPQPQPQPGISDEWYKVPVNQPEYEPVPKEKPGLLDGILNYLNTKQQPEMETTHVHEMQPEQPIIQDHTYDFNLPKHEPQVPNEKPGLLDKWYKYIVSTKEPEVQTPEHTYDFNLPQNQNEPQLTQDNWYKYRVPMPANQHEFEKPSEPKIQEHSYEPQVPNEKPGLLDKWYKYIVSTNEPEVQTPEHTYDFNLPQSQNEPELTQDNWYEYRVPIPANQHEFEKPEPKLKEHTYDYTMPEHEPQVPKEKPGLLDKWYKYIVSTNEPEIETPKHLDEQPKISEHTYDFNVPQTQNEPQLTTKDNWYKYRVPVPANQHEFEKPEPKIHEPQVPNEKPGLLDKWYKYKQPEVQTADYTYEYTMPKHDAPEQKDHTYEYTLQTHEPPGILDKWYNYIVPSNQPQHDQIPQTKPQDTWFKYEAPESQPIENNEQQSPNWLDYQPEMSVHNEGPQVHFVNHEPQVEQQQPNEWFTYQQPNVEEHGKPLVHFLDQQVPELHEPLVQEYAMPHYEINAYGKKPGLIETINKEHTEGEQPGSMTTHFVDYKQPDAQFEFTMPKFNFNEEPKYEEDQVHFISHEPVDYSTSSEQQPSSYIINYQQPLIHRHSFTPSENQQTTYWRAMDVPDVLKNYANDIYKNYSSELENLDNMKPFYQKTVSAPTYAQFVLNINKMKKVLNDWKNGDKFYDTKGIDQLMTMMSQLSNDTIELVSQSAPTSTNIGTTTAPTTTTTTDVTGLRRTFGDSEKLTEYLDDPENKKEFDTLDLLLQNLILAYVAARNDKKQESLLYLQKIKYLMAKYKKLFSHLEWVDGEIDALEKDPDIVSNPDLEDHLNEGHLALMKRLDLKHKFNYDINSRLFLTLLHMPVTAKSKMTLKHLIEKLLKDMVDLSEIDPEFKDVKFYLGEHKYIEQSPFYKRLMEFVVSPKDFIDDDKTVSLENRRANSEEIEAETETEVATTEMEEITTQPTTPKRKIEKHNNVFREFLMNTDE